MKKKYFPCMVFLWMLAYATFCQAAITYTFRLCGKGTVAVKATATGGGDCEESYTTSLTADRDGGQDFQVTVNYLCTEGGLTLSMTPHELYAFSKVVAASRSFIAPQCFIEKNEAAFIQILFNPPVNNVETTIHNVDGQGSNITSRAYTDGLGKPVQSVTSIPTRDLAAPFELSIHGIGLNIPEAQGGCADDLAAAYEITTGNQVRSGTFTVAKYDNEGCFACDISASAALVFRSDREKITQFKYTLQYRYLGQTVKTETITTVIPPADDRFACTETTKPSIRLTISYTNGVDISSGSAIITPESYVVTPLTIQAKERSLVSGSLFDELGRPNKQVLPFVLDQDNSLAFVPKDLVEGVDCAKAYYNGTTAPDAGDFPFTETRYYEDPNGRVKANGAPGSGFCIDENAGGHPVSTWYFGVLGKRTGDNNLDGNDWYKTWFDDDGFIKPNKLTPDNMDEVLPVLLWNLTPDEKAKLKYYLTVVRTPFTQSEYVYSQTLVDFFGKTIATATAVSSTKSIVSSSEFDLLGRITAETPPATPTGIDPTTFSYNLLGLMETKRSPDAGTVSYTYDEMGRVLASTDANGTIVENEYDNTGRIVTVSANGVVQFRNYYDYSEGLDQLVVHPSITPALLASLENTMGRAVLTVFYPDGEEPGNSSQRIIVDILSYDDEGRINKRYKIIPGLPFQEFRYGYDVHGKLMRDTVITAPAATPVCNTYTYDTRARLLAVYRDPDATHPLVGYSYDDLNKVTAKTYSNSTGQTLSSFTAYNIRDWVTRINDDGGFFDERLCYNEGSAQEPLFNGNISRIDIHQSATAYEHISSAYSYDNLNRLLSVHTTGVNGGCGGRYDDELDAVYSYDDAGRIVTKREGLDEQKTGFCPWGAYEYEPYCSRLRSVANSPKADNIAGENYIYDDNGNMILDRSKKLIAEYDWRNLPVAFMFFESIPASLQSAADVRDFVNLRSVPMVSAVVMMYDASGNRVKKEVIDPAPAGPGPGAVLPLEIVKNNTSISVAFDKNGRIVTSLPIVQESEDPPDAGMLEFIRDGETAASVSGNGLFIKGKLVKTAAIVPQTGDMSFERPDENGRHAPAVLLQASSKNMITLPGTIYTDIQGDFVSGVSYVEGSHVFERNEGENAYRLAYINFAEGKTLGNADNRVYYLKDHLGSARITLSAGSQFQKKEAIVYKAYGSEMVVDRGPASDVLRERFTGKELDKEGARFGRLTLDVTFNFALTHSDQRKSNRAVVYYSDAPQEPTKGDLFFVQIDPVTDKGRLTGTTNYTAGRTIARIVFYLNDETVTSEVSPITETVGPGTNLIITKTANSLSEFQTNVPKTFFTYQRDEGYGGKGILLSYFGKRYYDGEIGRWVSVDLEEQFVDGYNYGDGNPVNGIDPDGGAFTWGDLQYLMSSWQHFQNRKVISSAADEARRAANSALKCDYESIIKQYGYTHALQRGLLPKMSGDQYDAIRHATWSMFLIGKLGKDEATLFLNDYHERTGNEGPGYKEMDIRNNTAAMIYWEENHTRKNITIDIMVSEMLEKGLLTTAPVETEEKKK